MNCAQDNLSAQNNKGMFSSIHSFFIGMGSILDLYGDYYFITFREKSDSERLNDDWTRVGDDIRNSFFSKTSSINK